MRQVPSEKAVAQALAMVDINVVSGDVDNDTATITTGGMIGSIADRLDHLFEAERNTEQLARVILALGGGEGDDPVALAKSRMSEIAVYERETERQLQAGLDTIVMPKGGPPPEAFRAYTEQLNEMPLVKHTKKT